MFTKKIPTPEEIQIIRIKANIDKETAADLCGVTLRAWQFWESGKRKMPSATWELLLIKTNNHPIYEVFIKKIAEFKVHNEG